MGLIPHMRSRGPIRCCAVTIPPAIARNSPPGGTRGPPRHTSHIQSGSTPTQSTHCVFVTDRSARVLRSTTAVRTAAVVSVAPIHRVMSDAVTAPVRARGTAYPGAHTTGKASVRVPLPPCVCVQGHPAAARGALGDWQRKGETFEKRANLKNGLAPRPAQRL
jgi:hypothetical protein